MLRNLSLGCLLGLSMWQAPTQAQSLPQGQSGYYDASLIVGVDREQSTVTGYFESTTGWDAELAIPRFSCRFYFAGTAIGDSYKVTSWYPGQGEFIEGDLTFLPHSPAQPDTLQIRLKAEHSGCSNVQRFATDEGARFSLSNTGDWHSIRLVAAQKAYFHAEPAAETREAAYVIQGAPVRILQSQTEWVEAEFGQEQLTRGWLKRSDLYSSQARNGFIEGTVIFPSEFLPAQRVCAEDLTANSSQLKCVETREGQTDFLLEVAAGTYHVFAQQCDRLYEQPEFCRHGYNDQRAYYNEYVLCGITYQCALAAAQGSNEPIPVQVTPGRMTRDIQPYDWYTN